jgi:hypothetical protein
MAQGALTGYAICSLILNSAARFAKIETLPPGGGVNLTAAGTCNWREREILPDIP